MRTQTRHHTQKVRHGQHHRQNKQYLKTYLPYLPVVVSLLLSIFASNIQPAKGTTLAYATEMSLHGLLQSTNEKRKDNGQGSLQLNDKLISAAQAKANDMVGRNYWSHNTPDGQEPWVFMDSAGYNYQKAGENLAYGFVTSRDAVNGWMNSPSHKANMLDSSFIEVGFGVANGNNYNSSGPETVVVAMYGKPGTLGANASLQAQNSEAGTSTSQTPTNAPLTVVSSRPQPATKGVSQPIPVNTEVAITGSENLQSLSRVQALTGGNIPWALFAAASLTGAAVMLLLIKHGFALRHVLINSEKMVLRQLHHPLLDSIIISVIVLGYTMSRTVGFIG